MCDEEVLEFIDCRGRGIVEKYEPQRLPAIYVRLMRRSFKYSHPVVPTLGAF